MLEVKEACRILGLNEDAGKNEIEKRYTILLKKHRMAEEEAGKDEAVQEEFQRITEAYNLLMGYEEPETDPPKAPNPVFQKLGIDEKKTRNFFYYYKFHMIIGVILLVILFFTVRSFVTRVEPDFTTAFIGEISYMQTDNFIAQVKGAVPEIKEPGINGAYITASGNGQNDYAMMMKAIALFSSAGADLYIMDKTQFDRYTKQGVFASLDDIAPRLGADTEKDKDLITSTEDNPTAHLYGIDISDSSALAKAEIRGTRLVAAIPLNTKRQDTAIKLIEYLLKK